MEKERKEFKGLKKLRKQTDKRGPQYSCGRCKCKRYSPCGCYKETN